MRVIITAVGPNNWGLADPIVHYVTSVGACIAEIQMYDHDGGLFAILLRLKWPGTANTLADLRAKMGDIGRAHGLSIRTWARDEHDRPPRLAICMTYRHEPPQAVLEAIRAGWLHATPAVLIGNRPACESLATRFKVDWHMIGDAQGNPDNERMVQLFDRYDVDYIVLARYMRLIPPATCWKFAGGRIINLHHGLLPAFPGAEPYRDAYAQHMLTFGATAHFIVPELDAGGQIIHQETFTVVPGTPLQEVVRIGQTDHEPRCLVKGLQRVLDHQVELQFHKVAPVAWRRRETRHDQAHVTTIAHLLLGAGGAVPAAAGVARDAAGEVMLNGRTSMSCPTPTPMPVTQALGEWRKAEPRQQAKAVAIPARRRFNSVTVGLCLGGLVLGTAGCILGAVMPYRHPVGVAISVLWWGFYCGCLGASIGALIGQLMRRASTRQDRCAPGQETSCRYGPG
jgi:formyltetrahydrofolate deformylase